MESDTIYNVTRGTVNTLQLGIASLTGSKLIMLAKA